MKKVFFALLLCALALVPQFSGAQAVNAIVVTSCGTAPFTYTAGQDRPVVQDVNGNLCNGSGSGGSGTKIVGNTATDGSTTITSGGVAQNLFSSTVPTNGWTIINPDASEDCWASDTTTAAANATGSIRLAANGGGYETPPNRKPIQAVSVICPTTGHKLTASRW